MAMEQDQEPITNLRLNAKQQPHTREGVNLLFV